MKCKGLFLAPIITLSIIAVLLTAGSTSCSYNKPSTELADSLFLFVENSEIYYRLKDPDNKYVLPYALSEVSGLSFMGPRSLMMVEDENGKVYEYDLHNREVLNGIRFEDPGDFEGIEMVGEDIFVLRSDGRLYRMKHTIGTETQAEEIITPLRAANNVEGLGYDPEQELLLLACKDEAGKSDSLPRDGRAVYGFSLAENHLYKEPLFIIRNIDIETYLEKSTGIKYEPGRIKFKPSAIAYHPIEKRYYLMASTGKLILVLEKDGSIVASYPIYPFVLNQPEGICFGTNGDLFISSEGEGDRGFVLRFEMNRRN